MNSGAPLLETQSGSPDPAGAQGSPPLGGPGSGYGGGYAAPPGGGAPPPPGSNLELKKQATNWLIVSAVSFLICSGLNCFGLIGAILCFLAMQAADQGHVLDAESKLKWGKIITVVGAVLSVIALTLSVLYYFAIIAFS